MSTKLIKKSAVALAIGSVLATGSLAAQQLTQIGSPELAGISQQSQDKTVTQNTRYIVQLADAPLATYKGGVVGLAATSASVTGDTKLNISSNNAKQYRSFIQAKQKSVASQVSALANTKVTQSFDTVFNGLVVEAEANAEARLLAIPGVVKVFLDEEYETQLDASHEIIKSADAWARAGGKSEAGKGVKVAIIDSGIRPENIMFSGDGFEPAVFTEEQMAYQATNPDYCQATEADFCNNKLIVARAMFPLPSSAIPEEYETPLGYDGHGTHVAGAAVGNPTKITFEGTDVDISGVAPGAYLMVYKALYHNTRGTASGTGSALMGALDAAVKDGADVINNSWGGGAGGNPASSPYGSLFEAAEEAGVVVVTAAGNDGPGPQTIGCPGCVESGLTVANTQTGRFFSQVLTVNGEEYLANEGSNNLLTANLALPMISAELKEPENSEGCNAYSDTELFSGAVALVSRGSCAFSDKAANAAAAGAEAIVIHNNTDGGAMGMAMDDAKIPAIAVAQEDGKTLVDLLASAEAEITAELDPTVNKVIVKKYEDAVNTSSSRGPNGEPNFLKPDIAAPGTDILSAFSPDEGNGATFTTLTGTSMASPHVAGAAALVKQAHPEWNALDIKMALMTTSQSDGIHKPDGITDADAFDIGAGRLDIPSAFDAQLSFVHGSYADPSCLGTCSFTNTLKNMMDEAGEWTATVVTEAEGAAISVSPSVISLGAMDSEDASKEFNLDIDTTYASHKGWNFGHVVWTHTSGKVAHLPFAVYASEANDATILSSTVVADAMNAQTPIKASVMVSNAVFSDEINLSVKIGDGAKLLPGTTVQQSIDRGTGEVSFDTASQTINWKGKLDNGAFQVNPESTFVGGLSIVEAAGIAYQPCPDACDETTWTFGWDYIFDGKEYSQLTVSDNGFVAVGGFVNTDGAASPQQMPDAKAPNGIIAPMWADFDLTGTEAGDTGGGGVAAGVFNDPEGNRILIIEWHNAQIWNGDGTEYTFQVWLQEGSDVIRTNYVKVPTLPASYAIGAESADGESGVTANSIDTSSGAGYRIDKKIGGSVKLDYQLTAKNTSHYTSADSVMTDEEKMVNINVLANDLGESRFAIESNLSAIGTNEEFSSLKGVRVKADLQASSVMIVTQPENGTATVSDDGSIDYVPGIAFSGEDSLTYTVREKSGLISEPTMVKIVVNDTNTLPEVTVTEEVSVNEGATVTLEATATDAEQNADILTFTWTQTSGTAVELTDADKATATFTAGNLDSGTDVLEFEVSVNDGSQSSVTKMVTVTVADVPAPVVTPTEPKKKSSSGSLAWLMLLATPFAFLRRRKSQK
jgi:subtilisin family serine protease